MILPKNLENTELSLDLNNGITRAIFISWSTTPELRDKLIIYANSAQIKLKDSLRTFIETLSYPGAVLDWKLLQLSVTSSSDPDWRKNELTKPPFRKKRWDLTDARIDLAKLGPIFVKYSQKTVSYLSKIKYFLFIRFEDRRQLTLIFFSLIRSLSNFQVDFASDLRRLMCAHCHTNTSFRKLMWRHFTSCLISMS